MMTEREYLEKLDEAESEVKHKYEEFKLEMAHSVATVHSAKRGHELIISILNWIEASEEDSI